MTMRLAVGLEEPAPSPTGDGPSKISPDGGKTMDTPKKLRWIDLIGTLLILPMLALLVIGTWLSNRSLVGDQAPSVATGWTWTSGTFWMWMSVAGLACAAVCKVVVFAPTWLAKK